MCKLLYLVFFLLCTFSNGLCTNPSVIIVGAGSAGIAAATKLIENSITNITILEAEDRIGGRINTVKFAGGFVDLGAEFCSGEKGNIVYELVKDLDLLEHLSDSFLNNLYYSNGSKIDASLTEDLTNAIMSYEENSVNSTTGISVEKSFLNKYNSTILKKYANDTGKLKILTEGIKLAEDIILTNEGAFSWQEPSVRTHQQLCEGDQALTWKKRGYQVILEVLMKSYPNPDQKLPIDDKLILNKKVSKINWNHNDGVIADCLDNTSFSADHLIFTPSLGVLKDQKDALFHPKLPQSKEEAIRAMGFGAVMKIILHFPNKWWRDKDRFFFFLWSEEDLNNTTREFPDGPSKNDISWVAQIVYLAQVTQHPNVLIAWVVGDLVPKIEQLPKQTLKDGCMYVINKFLSKDYNITKPDEIIRSQWCSNSNFHGIYSYEKTEYFREDFSYHAQLGEPLNNGKGNPVLLFAGEATSSDHYGFVHGAIETGRREADRIINLYKQN